MWRAAARALAELGCAAFFIAGMASAGLSAASPWAVLAVVLLSFTVRAADLEARALFVPRRALQGVRDAGSRPAAVAAAALADRLMLGALAAVVAGHYLVAFGRASPASRRRAWLKRRADDVRAGGNQHHLAGGARTIPNERTVAQGRRRGRLLFWWFRRRSRLLSAAAVGHSRFSRPGRWRRRRSDSSCRRSAASNRQATALDLEQPRIRNLQRVLRLIGACGVVITAGLAACLRSPCAIRRSGSGRRFWVANHLAVPVWLRQVLVSLVAAAAVAFLAATIRSTARGAYGVLARLVDEGFLDERWRALHHQFGTPWRGIDDRGHAGRHRARLRR
jgi:hypothetical protein